MKLCIRKKDNSIVNDIQTGHPMDRDMFHNAIKMHGGTSDDYYTISITNREMFKAIMPPEAFEVYEFIKGEYLRSYMEIKMERPYQEIDPCWLEELEFNDGTNHFYKLYANKVLKRIKGVIKKVNGWVFRAENRYIGQDGKLYIKLCEKDRENLGVEEMQPESFVIEKNELLSIYEKQLLEKILKRKEI